MASDATTKSVMFVCLGNINRSACAHWILKRKADEAGLTVTIASSGTSSYHVGGPADRDMVKAASEAGYDLRDHAAAQVHKSDAEKYDYIIAMDASNMDDLKRLFPTPMHSKLHMFCSFCPDEGHTDVPDPYYEGGHAGVVQLVEKGVQGMLKTLLQ
jgi:protein-tyrosine phosphatase